MNPLSIVLQHKHASSLFPEGELDPKAVAVLAALGASGGGIAGALLNKKKRGKGALLGMGLGGLAGAAGATLLPSARFTTKAPATQQAGPNQGATGQLSPLAKKVSDFLRGDAKGLDWKWGFMGGSVPGIPAALISKAYNSVILNSGYGANKQPLYEKLRSLAAARGVQMVEGAAPGFTHLPPVITPEMRETFERLKANSGGRVAGTAEGFFTETKPTVIMKHKIPSLLAHELGHAEGWKGWLPAQRLGKAFHGLGASAALLSPDEEAGRAAAIAGTAAYAPVLLSEADASLRGYRLMRQAGAGRLGSLGSAKGLPTYLLNAALPAAAYLSKKELGGYGGTREY